MHDKYPHATQSELATLVDCDEHTVRYAMEKPEWKELDALRKEAANLDTTQVDAMDLLFKKLIQLTNQKTPDIRAVNALMTFLDKTGQLTPKGAEEEWQHKIEKLTVDGLVEVSTKKSPDADESESLYQ